MAISHYNQYIKEAKTADYKSAAQQAIVRLQKNPKDLQKLQTEAQATASAEIQAAYAKAVELQTASKFPEALAEYDKAIAAIAGAPNEPSYVYGKGTAYQASGDLDNAIKCYEKAVSLNGNEKAYRDALNGAKAAKAQPLVDSAIKKQTTDLGGGKYDLPGAIADYNAALKLYDDPATHMNLGTALQANNDNAGAMREYTRAIQLDASMADAYFYRAALYEFMQQKPAALKDYQKYLQLAPTGPNAAAAKEGVKRVGAAKK
jgi:tetratricopeptide (TPR) repeat protein